MTTSLSLLARRAASSAAALLFGTFLFGCSDGIAPGDYVVYRVSFSEAELSSSCFPNETAPPNEKSDSTTLREPGLLVIYASSDEAYLLDTGSATLEGTLADDTYSFSGKAVDVNFDGADGTGNKWTTTVTTTVEMTVDGSAVTGSVKTKTSFKCAGTTCGQVVPSCTESGDFVGTEVEDVEIDQGV